MNCEQVKSKLRLFREDLLPQYERYSIREHLFQCLECQELSQRFGDKTISDESVSRKVALPDPESRLRMDLELEKNFGVKEPSAAFDFNMPWGRILTVLLCAVFFGIGIVYFTHYLDSEMFNQESGASLSSGNGNPLSVTANSRSELNASSAKTVGADREVFVRPLHWDVYFPSVSSRDAFRARVTGGGLKNLYEDEALLVLNGDKAALLKLIEWVDEQGGVFKGGGSVRTAIIPDSDSRLKISLALHAPQSRVTKALVHHWHIRFDLPNRFLLKESLQNAGAKFSLDSNEVWVVEILGHQMESLKEILRKTHGVTVNFNDDNVSADSYKDIPVSVSLYIEEG